MKTLLVTTAVIELAAGLALLCCPSLSVVILVGAPLETSAALTVARVGGAALLALGIACWLARDDGRSRAGKGLVAAMALYDVGVVGFISFAGLMLGLRGLALWPAVGLHGMMSIWCLASLLERDPPSAAIDGDLGGPFNE